MMEQPVETAGYTNKTRPGGFILTCAIVFGISVAATIYFSVSMSEGMDMPGGWTMSMMWMRMPGQTWAASVAMFLLMCQSMMVAMMLPSAMPMLLRHHKAWQHPGALPARMQVLIVATGYFFVWLLIGVVVYAAGMAFALAAMRSEGLSRAVPLLSGAALIIVGAIQFSPWKMRGLQRCRNLKTHSITQATGKNRTAWRTGLSEGISCVICSSGPMLILLTLGAMNLLVMIGIAVMIAMEKLMTRPGLIVRIFGVAAVGAGVVMIVRGLFRLLTE